MHSFLITSKNKELAIEKVYELLREKRIDKFDTTFIESEKQIGIPDIKALQKNIYLKPLKSKEKALIISAVQGLTTEAQNALLKLLEEPPANTIIILIVETIDSVLPTIRSRCKIIELNNEIKKIDEKDNEKYLKLLNSLGKAGIGERLKIAQDISKNKDDAILIIEKIILTLRDEMLKNNNSNLVKKINKLQKTYTIIKNTNVNLRLAIENLFLNL